MAYQNSEQVHELWLWLHIFSCKAFALLLYVELEINIETESEIFFYVIIKKFVCCHDFVPYDKHF